MNLITILNFGSAVAAAGAAVFWFLVTTVPTPKHRGLTMDMTNFDFITVPLWKQTAFNRLGAGCAAVAALLQATSLLLAA